MNKNVLFDTSCGSHNMGDYIICESVERELSNIIQRDFLIKYATHTPIEHWYQNNKKNPAYVYCKEATYKFVAGTNIIQYRMLRPWTNWNINIFNCSPYSNSILVGAGLNPNRPTMDLYTKHLYKKILSSSFVHAARDQKTKEVLESLGLRAINTGCPTTWMLTKEHCAKIPNEKAQNVIFTLTDYRQDVPADQNLIDILLKNYKQVYFWVQGADDFQYLQSLQNTEKIQIIPPHLSTYQQKLLTGKVDYVGTRLHAGIYAMQNFVRSIILTVDNRAKDIKSSYNLNAVERHDIEKLQKMINSNFKTNLNINEANINTWKEQFTK